MKDKALDFSELEMQVHLYYKFGSASKALVPNVFFFSANESDMARILNSGYAYEYEIKRTRSDFKADMKKTRHRRLLNGEYKKINCYGNHAPLRAFYYVAPKGVIPVEQVPEYAGLIELNTDGCSEYTKNAPILSRERCEEKHVRALIKAGYHKLWTSILNRRNTHDEMKMVYKDNRKLQKEVARLQRLFGRLPKRNGHNPDQMNMHLRFTKSVKKEGVG